MAEGIMRRKDWYGYHIERTVESKTASVPAVSRISKISDFALGTDAVHKLWHYNNGIFMVKSAFFLPDFLTDIGQE